VRLGFKPVTVKVQLRDDVKRFFHGYVTRFGIGVRRGKYFAYQAIVNPWLWFLTRTADCRIFQEKTAREIIKEILGKHASLVKFDDGHKEEHKKVKTQDLEQTKNLINWILSLQGGTKY